MFSIVVGAKPTCPEGSRTAVNRTLPWHCAPGRSTAFRIASGFSVCCQAGIALVPESRGTFYDITPDFGERGFRKRNFCRRGTFQPNSQRKTLTVDQYHPLRALAALGFTDCAAPFFAGAKLPSKKVSSHCSRPSSSNPPSNVRQASSQTPCSCHCCNRRQQVEGEGNTSGRKRQAAPVCRIHKMPSKHARLEAHGRPRLSRRRLGGGSMGSTSFHCSSVNSFCRFFMAEVHQLTRLTREYLA